MVCFPVIRVYRPIENTVADTIVQKGSFYCLEEQDGHVHVVLVDIFSARETSAQRYKSDALKSAFSLKASGCFLNLFVCEYCAFPVAFLMAEFLRGEKPAVGSDGSIDSIHICLCIYVHVAESE